MSCLEFTVDNFDSEINGDQPVLVDFWAEWCSPCKMLSPIMENLSDMYSGRARIGKVNIEENSSLATRFEIKSIPTVLIFHNGKIIRKFNGIGSESAYRAVLDEIL